MLTKLTKPCFNYYLTFQLFWCYLHFLWHKTQHSRSAYFHIREPRSMSHKPWATWRDITSVKRGYLTGKTLARRQRFTACLCHWETRWELRPFGTGHSVRKKTVRVTRRSHEPLLATVQNRVQPAGVTDRPNKFIGQDAAFVGWKLQCCSQRNSKESVRMSSPSVQQSTFT